MTTAHGDVDDDAIAMKTIALLDARAIHSSICPSEVARALAASEDAWRALMPRVRQVAAGLASEGLLQATRKGAVVDATSPGGPIRLSRLLPVPRAADGDKQSVAGAAGTD